MLGIFVLGWLLASFAACSIVLGTLRLFGITP